jgi:hypothetical protein
MPDPDLIAQISARLDIYFDGRVPLMVRDKVVLQYRWHASSVTIFEKRPHFMRKEEWTESPVARFRFDSKTRLWHLDCRDRNGKWHEFEPATPSQDFTALLEDLDRDETCIFWG